jgi:hypothetical protein
MELVALAYQFARGCECRALLIVYLNLKFPAFPLRGRGNDISNQKAENPDDPYEPHRIQEVPGKSSVENKNIAEIR